MNASNKELVDYAAVLWRRRRLILVPTLFCVAATAVLGFLLPPKWEVDCLIQPSKYFITQQNGGIEEVLVASPRQVEEQINQNSYQRAIAGRLGILPKDFPKINAQSLKQTNLVRASVIHRDVDQAKKILGCLLDELKKEHDPKSQVESQALETQIKQREVDKAIVQGTIVSLRNKLLIVDQRKKEIGQETTGVRDRIRLIEREQTAGLKKENRDEAGSLSLLLYSNEVQQSLSYLDTLNELLNSKRIDEQDFEQALDNAEKSIFKIDNAIDNLRIMKQRIDETRFIKEPTPSLSPVSPKKLLGVLIAALLGLTVFSSFAYLFDYFEARSRKSETIL